MRKIYLTLLGFSIILAIVAANDEFYCIKEEMFQICKPCNFGNDKNNCEDRPSDKCKCDNLKMVKSDGGFELYGGPDECKKDDPFCFVLEDTNCVDAEYSSANERIDLEKYLDQEVYYSYDACDAKEQDKLGNEKYLDGKKITKDFLRAVEDNGIDLGEKVKFYFNSHDECADECRLRQGKCGAWSYNKIEEECYLHTVNANCGQLDKQDVDSEWISGYNQNNPCWSTRNDCPCDVKKRQTVSGTAHSTDEGSTPLHASGAVGTVNSNNKCQCKSFKTRRGRTRCRKPPCSKDGCFDDRKCRKRD